MIWRGHFDGKTPYGYLCGTKDVYCSHQRNAGYRQGSLGALRYGAGLSTIAMVIPP
jgi:hypothetical protein